MFEKMKVKRAAKKLARKKKKDWAIFKANLLVVLNAQVFWASTGLVWFFGKKKFNAVLVGQRELAALKEMPYAYKEGMLRYDDPTFISYICPKKTIKVVPVDVWTYAKLANVVI